MKMLFVLMLSRTLKVQKSKERTLRLLEWFEEGIRLFAVAASELFGSCQTKIGKKTERYADRKIGRDGPVNMVRGNLMVAY